MLGKEFLFLSRQRIFGEDKPQSRALTIFNISSCVPYLASNVFVPLWTASPMVRGDDDDMGEAGLSCSLTLFGSCGDWALNRYAP
jgi:hypothetical protein